MTLRWPQGADAERDALLATGIDLVVAKPVSGTALVSAVLAAVPNQATPRLVSQAA